MAKTIMIVDDSEDDRFIAKRILRRHFEDVTILEACDGTAAIEVLEKTETLPDLIFLDINMPRMNGHEFLLQWYEKRGHEIPIVIMLTSSDQTSDIEQTQVYDVVKGYILKPMSTNYIPEIENLLAVT